MEIKRENNVNIYNLSSGKSLPDWISERKRRALQKKDIDIRRRIELIQDFEMPGVSNNVKMSRDGSYIFATGIYKPRVRCYEVNNLSMKFERCFDNEAVQFELISDDYSKFALLYCDRYIELHVQYGTYYKTRVPKCGRDIVYHRESCDLLVVGSSSEIYRLNLAQGRFLNPYHTNASSINKISVHEPYDLIACGTMEGKVEAWDPRMRERVSTLDCAFSCMTESTIVDGFPSITALSFKGDLTMAVGTFTGQILLYDIRSNKPFLVKDNSNGQPIKNVAFIPNEELVASLDPKCVKFWRQNTGQLYTSINSPTHLNDLCIVPNTGLVFMAHEEKKIQSYFIPSIGPAPKWCCFLDNITEELEESKQDTVYDDYKFVTEKEIYMLHLDHLIGTNLLRGYMHGYFMDIRLYNKAKAIVQPEAQKELKKKMILERIDKERSANQIQLTNQNGTYPVVDERFKAVNDNPDFKIEETADEYRRIKGAMDRANKKAKKLAFAEKQQEEEKALLEDEGEEHGSSSDYSEEESESSDEEQADDQPKKPKKMFEAVESDRFSMLRKNQEEDNTMSIEEKLRKMVSTFKVTPTSAGNQVVTWKQTNNKQQFMSEKRIKREEERKAHLKERSQFRRPAKYMKTSH